MNQSQVASVVQPVSFILPNSNGERYYLSVDVSAYLNIFGGIFKKYPRLWKRPLSTSEKTYLKKISICKHHTRSYVVRCRDVDKLIRQKYSNGAPAPLPSNSVSLSMNGESSTYNDMKFSELSEFSDRSRQGSSSNVMNSSNSLSTPMKLKPLKMVITANDLKIPRIQLDTLNTKPLAFVFVSAEGSETERYYTSNDVLVYTRRRFNVQHYPLMWRKSLPNSELIHLSVRVSTCQSLTTIYRAREVDEIVTGLDLKYCIPITADNRLRSFSLDDGDERYYIAHFVGLATNTKLLQCYKLWKRLITKTDQVHLRRQGLYGTSLTWMMLKVREVDDLFEGRLDNYYPPRRSSTGKIIKPISRSLLKKARNARRVTNRARAPVARKVNNVNNVDVPACEWQLHDDNGALQNGFTNEMANGVVNNIAHQPVDVVALKEKVMRDAIKMCVYLRMPLTVVENDMFRSICQTYFEIGRDCACQSRLDPSTIIPSYAETRAFVDKTMASAREALIKEAHGVAVSGGIAVSIYCNAFTKSHNLVFVTLHFISNNWILKTVTTPPVSLTHMDGNNSDINFKNQVLNAIGIAPAAPMPLGLTTNGLKIELNDEPNEPMLKSMKVGGDPLRVEAPLVTSPASTNSTDDNLHFVMNNLFGEYFRDLSRDTKFLSSTSVTRCCVRYIGVLRWKISSKQKKMNLSAEQIRQLEERLLDPVYKMLNGLKKDDVPTVNRILPIVREWIQYYRNIASEENALMREIAEEMLEECQTTYDKHLNKDLFFFAIILDPSQKNKIREYLPDKQKKNELTERFKAAVAHYRTLYGGHGQEAASDRVVDSFFDDEELRQEDDIDKEILSYLCTPSVEFTANGNPKANSQMKPDTDAYEDVLDFWRRNEKKFPNCARLARRILAIPATAERDALLQVFTTGGSKASNIDAEVLRQEAQAKSIVDMCVLLAMSR